MKTRVGKWAIALVMAVTLAFGLAQGAAAKPVAQPELPQTKTPKSVKFDLTGSVTVNDQTISLEGSGAAMGQDLQEDVILHAPEGTTSGPQQITFSVVLKDKKYYFKA